jgi:glycosyltransferase involved in cell wall biosynthesis
MSRLLVITEELPSELAAAGSDPHGMAAYYNPAGCFNEVALIDWGRAGTWPELPCRSLELAPDPALESWLNAVQSADFNRLMSAELQEGWPGVPAHWLERIRDFAPDCIRAYGLRWSAWLALEVAEALDVPVLCSAHNVIGLASPALARAPVIMAVSDQVAQACIDGGANPANVVTVLNRVDRERFTPDGPKADGPQGSPRLLCVARDVAQKNLDRLLEACKQAAAEHPDLKLVHIGASSRDWSKHPFALHMDAVPNADIAAWLRWADCLVLPSLFEGFPKVLAEALACGTPVLTSNRAPMNEAVSDGWDGLLFDPESVNEIARALSRIADSGLRARLAAPARASSEPYDREVIDRREAALYRWILGNERPKISVVMPTYNRADWLAKALPNVLEQDYPALELIVVNDGSTDDTAKVLEQFSDESRLRVITQDNMGLPHAINAGVRAATGELLTWKADDDFYLPGALGALARELVLDPAAGMVFADYVLERGDGTSEVIRTGPVHELSDRNVVGLCFLFRRELFQAAGEVNPEYHLAEDYELWVRMARHAPLKRLPRVLYRVTDHDETLTRSRYAEVLEMTWNVRQQHFPDEADNEARAGQLGRLASAYKAQGMPYRSFKAGCNLARLKPAQGLRAIVRALTPMPLLRLRRKLVKGRSA